MTSKMKALKEKAVGWGYKILACYLIYLFLCLTIQRYEIIWNAMR